jgi:hypothetical protein
MKHIFQGIGNGETTVGRGKMIRDARDDKAVWDRGWNERKTENCLQQKIIYININKCDGSLHYYYYYYYY